MLVMLVGLVGLQGSINKILHYRIGEPQGPSLHFFTTEPNSLNTSTSFLFNWDCFLVISSYI
jgi:hypothetical protein